MRTLFGIAMLGAAALALIPFGGPPAAHADRQEAAALLQEALYLETGEGDLPAAMAAYQRVIDLHPAYRDLAGRALLGIARCQERAGDLDASLATLERALEEFPDVADVRDEATEAHEIVGRRRAREAEERRIEEIRRRMSALDWQGRIRVVEEISSRADRDALPLVREALSDADPRVRIASIRAIEALGDRGALARLIELSRDPRADVSEAARHAMEAIQRDFATRTGAEGNAPERASSAEVLAFVERLPADQRAGYLVILLDRSQPSLRAAAALLLGDGGVPNAVAALRAHADDPDAEVRTACGIALWRLGEREGAERLVRALASSDDRERRLAIEALEGLFGTRLGFDPDAPEASRRDALARWAQALERLGRW